MFAIRLKLSLSQASYDHDINRLDSFHRMFEIMTGTEHSFLKYRRERLKVKKVISASLDINRFAEIIRILGEKCRS